MTLSYFFVLFAHCTGITRLQTCQPSASQTSKWL